MSRRLGEVVWVGVMCVVLIGCASTTNKSQQSQQAWGSHATLFPSWERLSAAAVTAVRAPQTWAPAMGAVLFSATSWDKDVSGWAQDHRPVFGSQHAALQASVDLRDGAKYGAIATALLTPNGSDDATAVMGKLKGMGLQMGAYITTEGVAKVLKRGVARRRPNSANNRSFPASHTSTAFAAGTLASRNMAVSAFDPTIERVLNVGFISLGVGTSWARVEAGMHYPSDVFAGAALGHFIAAVVNDAFIDSLSPRRPRLSIQAWGKRVHLNLNWLF